MDIEVYFSEIKKKYGVSDNLSSLIERLRKDYMKIHPDLSDDGRERNLRSLEAQVKVSYEIHMVHEDPEFKDLFALVRKYKDEEKEVKPHAKPVADLKPIVEGLLKELDSFKEKIDKIEIPEKPKTGKRWWWF